MFGFILLGALVANLGLALLLRRRPVPFALALAGFQLFDNRSLLKPPGDFLRRHGFGSRRKVAYRFPERGRSGDRASRVDQINVIGVSRLPDRPLSLAGLSPHRGTSRRE